MADILIVDDERSIRVILREVLFNAGYEVSMAEDADEAMTLIGTQDFDVVLSDIILPGVTGVKLLEAIKEISPRVQVILMTGEPSVETATDAVRAGAFDYVTKPFDRHSLLGTIANAVQVKELEDERRRLAAENQKHREELERLVAEGEAALKASNRALTVLSECGQALVRAAAQSQSDSLEASVNDPSFIKLILATFESALQRAAQTTVGPKAVANDPDLIEALSTREIEIVALLSERMRDKEIAARLFIAPETVKSHLRNIYGKLEAHGRREAVDRAIEFGILESPN